MLFFVCFVDTQGSVTVQKNSGPIRTQGSVRVGGSCQGNINTMGSVHVAESVNGSITTMGRVTHH